MKTRVIKTADHKSRSAGFQPAVSPASSRQTPQLSTRVKFGPTLTINPLKTATPLPFPPRLFTLLLLFLLTASARAQFTSEESNNEVTITGYSGPGGAVTIPSTIDGLPVASIGEGAFQSRTNVTSITIPNTVTSIGAVAFSGCTSLVSVNIPSAVTSIQQAVFEECVSLNNVTIPEAVTNIHDYAFLHCASLTSIKIPNNVTAIGYYAFRKCASLTNVTIPRNVTTIDYGAFDDCVNLSAIYFKGDAPALGWPELGSGVLLADNAVVYYLPGTTGWGESFANLPTAPWLPKILSPSLSTQPGHFGFTISWTSGQSIVVEACANLDSPSWIPIWANTLLADSVYFTDQDSANFPSRNYRVRLETLEYNGFLYTIENNQIAITSSGAGGDVSIPDKIYGLPVTRIAELAFLRAPLTSITIPPSLTNIGWFPFAYCNSLRAIIVDPLNPAFSSVDGVLFSKNQKTLVAYPGGKGGIYTLPNTVTNVGDYAFTECPTLESVTLPGSLISIGFGAFARCTSLTMVTIPNGVISIGEAAFQDCRGLTNISLPNTVLTIGSANFVRCTALTSLSIPASVTSFGEHMIEGSSNLTAIVVHPLNSNYSSEDGVMFNKNKTTLLYCPGGKPGSYTIPNGVATIRANAFDRCFNLTTVTIPSSVTSIENLAFYFCSSLQRVNFGGNPPMVGAFDVFGQSSPTIYYLPAATGWGPTFAGRPTALWN